MTIDLGFARFCSEGIEAGIVDVPGHEKFVHNMLAGAAGVDLLLLVVALDDGAMPQTFEHLQALRYLNVRDVIVAATKADLLDDATRAKALDVLRLALHGTIAADAPFYSVSNTTGEGIGVLREALASALRALPARDASAPAYLPIDRVFVLPGIGTVVTGTLMQGTLHAGATVTISPSQTRAKARALHVFDVEVASATPGSRVAVNIASLDASLLHRGDVVTDGATPARDAFDVLFIPEPDAIAKLKRRMPVRVHLGTAELIGTLVFDALPTSVEGLRARLHLRTSVLAFPGAHFVVRGLTPKRILGGGTVDPGVGGVREALRAAGANPQTADAIGAASNLHADDARATLETMVASGAALRVNRPEAFLDADEAGGILALIRDTLAARETSEPWAMGATPLALSRELKVAEALLVRLMSAFVERGDLVRRAGYYATVGFVPALTPGQQLFFDELPPIDPAAPLRPIGWEVVATQMRLSHVPGITRAFDMLEAAGRFVRIGDDCYRGTQVAEICTRVQTYLLDYPTMTASAFRDLIGTSRKYAMPLLEWLDAHGITVRVGDERVLRSTGGEPRPA